jgi:DNA (cytosine-5)-methyltransferase 1
MIYRMIWVRRYCIVLDNPNSKTKRSRIKPWLSSTLTCAGLYWVITNNYRIRRMTPVEYERAQGFLDGHSSNIVSNSQAYKQMWNAISVPVVKNIFDNLL